jgi:hypothetical protein
MVGTCATFQLFLIPHTSIFRALSYFTNVDSRYSLPVANNCHRRGSVMVISGSCGILEYSANISMAMRSRISSYKSL